MVQHPVALTERAKHRRISSAIRASHNRARRQLRALVPRRRGEAKPLHDFGFDRGGEKPILAIGKAADFGELLEQFGVFLAHGIEFAAQVRQVVKLLFGERRRCR
jgi:hypothetical protein